MTAGVSTSDLVRDVEAFLIAEARLMDDHDYDAWMELWEPDLRYWIPCDGDDFDPRKHVSIAYENHASLSARVARLKGKHAFSQRPKSKLLRVVSNVSIVAEREPEILTSSAFVLGEVRNGRQTVYLGRNEHILIRRANGLRIKQKKILLLNNDVALNNLTFLL